MEFLLAGDMEFEPEPPWLSTANGTLEPAWTPKEEMRWNAGN